MISSLIGLRSLTSRHHHLIHHSNITHLVHLTHHHLHILRVHHLKLHGIHSSHHRRHHLSSLDLMQRVQSTFFNMVSDIQLFGIIKET